MQFALPEHLKVAVAAYDPTLKVLARQEAAQKKPKKPSYSMGLPDDLIPTDLLPAARQVEIAKQFHERDAAARAVNLANLKDGKIEVCIMHHRSLWMAAWVDRRQSRYLYGFTYAYKAANSVASKVDPVVVQNNYQYKQELREKETEVKYGRTAFRRFSTTVTRQNVADGWCILPWESLLKRWGRDSQKYEAFRNFTRNGIKPAIHTFDNAGCFSRLAAIAEPAVWLFSGDRFGEKLTPEVLARYAALPERVANTPFFRKEFTTAAAEFNRLLLDNSIRAQEEVRSPVKKIGHRAEWIRNLLDIYPDASLDYIQQFYDVCVTVSSVWGMRNIAVREWLRENMPIASFIRLFRSFNESKQEELSKMSPGRRAMELRSATGYIDGFPTWNFGAFNDSLNMLANILQAAATNPDVKIERPDRWRITEFHDYLMGLNFKIHTVNDPLPQHLFPQPVRVIHNGTKWSFFQPADVHQLASWGQAVRNCVGSASNYRDGIKRKTHFIVLAMIDNRPQFTIQLRVDNGTMSVTQIAGIGNRGLTDTERSDYEKVFAEALNKQNEILAQEAA